jgi:hypothetical protein
MTYIHTPPSPVSLLQVRESFMRQYLEEEGEEEDVPLTKGRSMRVAVAPTGALLDPSTAIAFRKRRPVRLIASISFPRNADADQKRVGIANIIRWASSPASPGWHHRQHHQVGIITIIIRWASSPSSSGGNHRQHHQVGIIASIIRWASSPSS